MTGVLPSADITDSPNKGGVVIEQPEYCLDMPRCFYNRMPNADPKLRASLANSIRLFHNFLDDPDRIDAFNNRIDTLLQIHGIKDDQTVAPQQYNALKIWKNNVPTYKDLEFFIFSVNNTMPVQTDGVSTINVDEDLADRLPGSMIEKIVLHEIFHMIIMAGGGCPSSVKELVEFACDAFSDHVKPNPSFAEFLITSGPVLNELTARYITAELEQNPYGRYRYFLDDGNGQELGPRVIGYLQQNHLLASVVEAKVQDADGESSTHPSFTRRIASSCDTIVALSIPIGNPDTAPVLKRTTPLKLQA